MASKKASEQQVYNIEAEYQYPKFTDAKIQNYLDNRILRQIKWYDNKSIRARNWYKIWMILSIAANGLIPIVSLLDFPIFSKIAVVLLGSFTAAITAVLGLFGYKDLWSQYRYNCEMLKSMLHRFYTDTGEFALLPSGTKKFNQLVASSEEYMTNQFKNWLSGSKKQNENDEGDKPNVAEPLYMVADKAEETEIHKTGSHIKTESTPL